MDRQSINSSTNFSTTHRIPLSDFEWYMLCDDRPSHPMVFVVAADVIGRLSEPEFRQAARDLLASQPLLRSVVDVVGKSATWRQVEIPADIVTFEIVSDDELSRRMPGVTRIDIRTRPGIQIEVLTTGEQAKITLHLHHSCCDGIAGAQLIAELLARYG